MSLGPIVRVRPLTDPSLPHANESPWCEEPTPEFLAEDREPAASSTAGELGGYSPLGACRGLLILAGLASSSGPPGSDPGSELRTHLRAHLYGACWSAAARAGVLPHPPAQA